MANKQPIGLFVAGLALTGLGGLFLIAQLFGGSFWGYFWPYPIIALGFTFLATMVSRGRGAGGFAIPGTVITTIGVLLFIQNSFGWWESWAFAWTFIVIAVGVGIFLMGYWNESEGSKRTGLNIAGIGTLLLMLFGSFFGMGFSFLGFSFAARVIWPVVLVGTGAFLILRGVIALGQNSPKTLHHETKAEPTLEHALDPALNHATEKPLQSMTTTN